MALAKNDSLNYSPNSRSVRKIDFQKSILRILFILRTNISRISAARTTHFADYRVKKRAFCRLWNFADYGRRTSPTNRSEIPRSLSPGLFGVSRVATVKFAVLNTSASAMATFR